MASLKIGINCLSARICGYGLSSRLTMPVLTATEKPLFSQPVRFRFANWQMLKDYKKRQTIKEQYTERLRINAIRKNTILPKELREVADEEVAALPRNSSIVRIRQRCVLTSRPRGVLRRWRISRIMWRHLADYNQLSGITRSCW
ncbi:28S ribosomal protein S14, mitochondrial [Octopus bimaculoides]|uniref:28S ribosomal protein S14, mitochondrial n=1 Tax=Octopus bimaculoides TaxID=37653 RepID=A0A0L8G9Y5_OCTBM|nr:28S ribosomal protein S14, mitochondrial [Octopus bimaculoides]|eukprot:XP_014782959.1 PREDICTED: 28S ribosomal protein S14, mitochondrial-like [Octopus bimaculoides]